MVVQPEWDFKCSIYAPLRKNPLKIGEGKRVKTKDIMDHKYADRVTTDDAYDAVNAVFIGYFAKIEVIGRDHGAAIVQKLPKWQIEFALFQKLSYF